MEFEQRAAEFRDSFQQAAAEIGKVVVGHEEVVRDTLATLFCGGHVLLEGVPGLGKTLLVRTLGQVLDLKFSRIQFTPDLMPADIIGTSIIVESEGHQREFRFQRGPLFAQLVLADEINRATPKTQSALLEAMQERNVSVGGVRHALEEPFFILATQNPIEMEGTYPLPEAQLDRFLVKLNVPYSSREELRAILDRTTEGREPEAQKRLDAAAIARGKALVREIVVAPHVKDYLVRLVLATHPGGAHAPAEVTRFVRFGASPRGAQALNLMAKVQALLAGRYHVGFQDVQEVLPACLRHRVLVNFEGEAEGLTSDRLLQEVLRFVPRTLEQEAPAAR